MDPNLLMAMGQGGGNSLSALGDYIATEDERGLTKDKRSRQKELWNILRWQLYGKQGPVISQQTMNQLLNRWRQSMGPTFAKLSYGASRHAGMRSPQTHAILANARLPLEGGFLQALQQQNIGLTQQRDQDLLRLMASLSGGG